MSDTHDHVNNVHKAIDIFLDKEVEHIIHLGDIISPFIPRFMKEKIGDKPVKITAVLGNNDGDIYLLHKLFNDYGWILYKDQTVIEIGGKKFLIMHGYNGIEYTEKLAIDLLKTMDIDGVLYGHTHRARFEVIDGKILLNPGEACGYLTGKASIALLDTVKWNVEFIYL